MKKATNETRIRITIKMPSAVERTLTMTAFAWCEMASVFSSAGYYSRLNGLDYLANCYWAAADRIHRELEARRFYD